MRRFSANPKRIGEMNKKEVELLREDQKVWRDNKAIDRAVKRKARNSSPKTILRKASDSASPRSPEMRLG